MPLCEHAQNTGIYLGFASVHNIVHNDMVMAMIMKMLMITVEMIMAPIWGP